MADFCKRIVIGGNWDLRVQDRYIIQACLPPTPNFEGPLKKEKWFSCFILCLQSWLSCFLWCQPHQIFRENYRHQKGALGFFARKQILFFAHLNKNADPSK